MQSSAQKKLGFLHSIRISMPDLIFLVRGKDESGQRAWYYILVDRYKRDIFKQRNGVAQLNLADYGRILHSGFGSEPPASIKIRMQEEYGFKE